MTSADEDMPPSFGIARIEETGTASYELLYEHEYFPQPVWVYSETLPVARGAVLRPAVRNGKVDFQFFGNRVPLSGDHARCWLGQVLLSEVRKGLLSHVEFIVKRFEDLSELLEAGEGPSHLRRHGPQLSWLWHVWPASTKTRAGRDGPSVEILLRMSGANGITLDLICDDQGQRAAVFRVLKQYCDDDTGDPAQCRPIPDPPSRISKVLDRECSPESRRRRAMGMQVAESGGAVLKRSLNDWNQAETRLVQAVARAQAAQNKAGLRELLLYCTEVRDAVEGAGRVWLKLRPEWTVPATETLDVLLRRSLDTGDEMLLNDALAMTHSMCSLGVGPPDCLEEAVRAQAHFDQRQLASSLALQETAEQGVVA